MAMHAMIIKNPGASAVMIEDLGISIPASGQVDVADQFTYSELADSDSLRALVLAGTLVVNDGSGDLSSGNGVTYLTFVHKQHLEDKYYSKTEISTSGQAVVDWGNVANAPSFGSPSWVDSVKAKVRSIAAAAPGTPATGDIFVDTDDQHYYKYNGASWDDIGAAASGDRVIKLDEGDEAIFVFNGTDTWTDQTTPDENTGVIVEDDGDGKAAQYVYSSVSTSWIKIADADFADHLNSGAAKHAADQISVAGTFSNIPGTADDVEEILGDVNTKLGTMDSSISANASAVSDAQDDADAAQADATQALADAAAAQGDATQALSDASDAQNDIDGHLDGTASKHDATEVDLEGTFSNIPGSPATVEAGFTQVDNQLGTLAGLIPTTFNTLDAAYDEGGSGAGREITADSGPVKINTVGTAAGLEVVPKSAAPSTGLLGGQFHVDSNTGILYVYDATRSKWLSVNRFFIAFGKNGKTRNQMLSYYAGGMASNNSGLRVLRNACVIGATGQLDASGTCDFRLRKNDAATNIATLAIDAALGAVDGALSVDVSINDYLQCYIENTAKVNDPMVMLEIAWRL